MRSGSGPRRRLALACTTAAALAFAGCGSAAEQERERSERERARAALLTQNDLPAEWTQVEVDDTSPSPEELKRLCPGSPAHFYAAEGEAFASFESDSGAITQGVMSVADEQTAAEQFDSIADEAGRRCMRAIVDWSTRSAAEESGVELKVSDVEVEPVRRDDAGERGMRLTMTMGTPDGSVALPVEAELVATREGRTFSSVMVLAVQQPLDGALLDRLAEISADRLQQNFG